MKANAIMKAIGNAEGRGMAETALSNLPDTGQPADLPVQPEPEAMGPPDVIPPVEPGEAPEFEEFTGLPLVAIEHTPAMFPAEPDDNGVADDVLDLIFA
ncbi:MAG: hypothetical protein HKN18_11400 [Silicimonas sp.]|nr:hypothetical protein [Silicimonas sp.]